MLLPKFFEYAHKIGYERRWIFGILALQLFAVFFEGIGIGAVLPILQYMNSGGDVARLAAGSQIWSGAIDVAKAMSIPISLATLLFAAFVAVVLRQTFLYMRNVVTATVQFELQRRVKDAAFNSFIRANLGYHDRMRAGDFVNELTTELQFATGAMTSAANFLGSVVLCSGYLLIAAMLSLNLTLIAVAVCAVAVSILLLLMRRMGELGAQVTRANQDMSSFLVERLKSVRLVRLSGVEQGESAMLAARTREQRDRIVEQRTMLAKLSVLVEPIVLAMAFVLLYLSVTVFKLEVETIILFFFVLLRLVPIMKETLMYRQGYISSLASVQVVERRMRSLVEARDPAGGSRIFDRLASGIMLRDVSFQYAGAGESHSEQALALDHLSLTIPAHRTTALVGPSGSGKSTLVDLLPRLREPDSGKILFDGIPQHEFMTSSLRRAISFAPQMPHMFNVTIAEHIRYGWPEASMDDVRTAAGLAQAAQFIEAFPDGYNTLLGEGGSRLSGGQRQRVDLARALVRRSPILILDEPTANLDAEAEALLREALAKIRRDTEITIVIIGHRLSTIMSADQIAVLDTGQVLETGTHAQLMARGGWYARAFERQNGRTAALSAS